MATIIGQGGAPAPAADGGGAQAVTAATFQAEVLEASRDRPVIVDFWAPWCGPCKQIAPALEKIVGATGGKAKLVKINIDEEPRIAQALRVRSIPAVFAFDGGQPVDGFVGAQPESQIRAFVERVVGAVGPSPAEQALERADAALEAGEAQQAAELYRQVAAREADNTDAIAGLGRALIALGRADEVGPLLDGLDDEIAGDDKIQGLKAQLELMAGAGGDLAGLEARVAADGGDLDARLELARAYAAADRREEAVDQLIAIVGIRRDWHDEIARTELVRFFEAWGPTDAATLDGRRKLSAAWFS